MTSEPAKNAALLPEKLVRDVYDYLPHRVAAPGERYMLLAAKFDEEVAEVKAASIGTPEFIEELADLVEVCYALGGQARVEDARTTKLAERGGFDRGLVMRLEDRDGQVTDQKHAAKASDAERANAYRIEADCAMRDYDSLELRYGIALDALREIVKAASPREWETPGHPMNSWTKREPILRIARQVLDA